MSYPNVRPLVGFSSLDFLRAKIISSLFSTPALSRILRNGAAQAIYAILFPKLKSSPYITRCLYWDINQGQKDSRYWSECLEPQLSFEF
jgi:hypothetical protein